MTRTIGSVPDLAQQHPPGLAELSLGGAHGGGETRARSTRLLSTSLTLMSTCGSGVITAASSASVRPVSATREASMQPGQHAVAGGGVVEHDDVARLLAAERVAAAPSSPPARSGRPTAVCTTLMPVALASPA